MSMRALLRQIPPDELQRYLQTPGAFFGDLQQLATPVAPAPHDVSPLDQARAALAAVQEQALKASQEQMKAAMKEINQRMKSVGAALQQLPGGQAADASAQLAKMAAEGSGALEAAIAAQTRAIEEARRNPVVQAAIQQLTDAARSGATPAPPADLTLLELEKSWHCLNFILTGDASLEGPEVERSPILGGSVIPEGKESLGYGPPRCFAPQDVTRIANELAVFNWTERIATFDVDEARQLDLYVPDHSREELSYWADALTKFYEDAARRGNAVVAWIE